MSESRRIRTLWLQLVSGDEDRNALDTQMNTGQGRPGDEKTITNPDEKGMAHGRMGWLAESPGQFYSYAADGNKTMITNFMKERLGSLSEGTVLEVGSGSGQHVVEMATALPALTFQPTEYPGHPNPRADPQDIDRILGSIRASVAAASLANVKDAAFLDASALASAATDAVAPPGSLAAIGCFNVVHISPIEVLNGLLAGASAKLRPGYACV